MKKVNLQSICGFFVAMLIAAFFGVYLQYVYRVSYNVPHMDAWLTLAERIEKYMEGNITFQDVFPIPHDEYFSLLHFPINYVLTVFFKLNYQLLTYTAAIFLLAESVIIYRAYRWSISRKDKMVQIVQVLMFGFLLLAVYNLNQWEIASFYCAFVFFLRTSFYCYMFYYIDKVLHKAERHTRDYVYAGILCVIAIIVISHAYFPGAIATVALIMIYDYISKRDWKKINYYLIVAGFVVGAGILYIATYSFKQISGGSSSQPTNLLNSLWGLIRATVLMASAPLAHSSMALGTSTHYLIGIGHILISAFAVICYFARKEHKQSYMPLMLILYGYISIIIISLIRLKAFSVSYVLSSRYVVETTLILLGEFWILITLVADAFARKNHSLKRKSVSVVAMLFVLLLAWGIHESNSVEWGVAPYRRAGFKQNAYKILNVDYVTDRELAGFQAPAGPIRRAVKMMEKYELGVFYDIKESVELQSAKMERLDTYQYKVKSGVYADSWCAPKAVFYVKTGAENKLDFRIYYPFEITGNEMITITIGDVSTDHYITQSNDVISVDIPCDQLIMVTVECNFGKTIAPDVRELSYIFSGFSGYLRQKEVS